MKKLLLTAVVALALGMGANAATVTLSGVHICCGSCVKAIGKIEGAIPGITAVTDEDAGTVALTAPDTATLQKGTDALVAAGFYGKSSDPSVTVTADTGVKNQKVQSMTIEHLHICCGHCVKDINETLAAVPGVTTNTAAKGVTSFVVTGDFNDKDVMDALQKAGLTGHEK